MIKLFGLDRKSQFKMNNYLCFYLFLLNSEKACQNGSRMNKIDPKCPLFDSI